MKAKTFILILAALCFVDVMVSYGAEDAFMGTWKLNEAKSKFGPGATRLTTVAYEAASDNVKVTADGTDSNGAAIHHEWTGKFDGKDYPVTGDPTSDIRSYKKISDHTMALTAKKGGKVTTSGRIVVSADGKTRTVTTHTTDEKGNKTTSIAVYDKQ